MINWQRAIARKIATTMMAAACVLPTLAQTQQQSTPPAPTQTQQDQDLPPRHRPLPTRSIGLTPGNVVRWTLRDTVLKALENNVDIEVERESVRLRQFDIDATRAPYDPLTSSTITYNSSQTPLTNPFAGAQLNQSSASSKSLTYNFGWQQAIEKTGANYNIFFNNTRVVSNTSNLTTQYNPSLNLSVTQPLFRNFKIDANRRQIKIAKKSLDLSDAVFRQRAIEIISRVQQAYWDLAFAIKDEEIQRQAVELAETSLRNNERQVEVGTLAPLDVTSAATDVESRRLSYFQALNTISATENSLKALVVASPTDELWGAQIIPVDTFDIQPLVLPLDDAIKLAFANRPELKQFDIQRELNKIDVDFFRDQTKPQIDLVANFNLIGLSGNSRLGNASQTCSNPFTLSNGNRVCIAPVIVQQGDTFVVAPGTPTPFQVTPGAPLVAQDFIGGYFTGFGNIFSFDNRSWRVGVNFSLPLRNVGAKASLGRALEQTRQLDVQLRRQLQSIELEVRNQIQSLETIKMRIETAKANRIYAQRQLEGEQKKFEAGLSPTFLVLQRQNQLTAAQGQEQRALADYNKAVAELQRVISTTLSSNNIEVRTQIPVSSGRGKR